VARQIDVVLDDGWTHNIEAAALESLPRPLRVAVDQPVIAEEPLTAIVTVIKQRDFPTHS
jgi:hypothetical protein